LGGARSEDDDHWHTQIANHFLAGNGLRLDTEFGPTYSYIQPGLAVIHILFMKIFPDFIFAERVFLNLFSSFSIVIFFFIARRLFSPATAAISTFALILYPPQWFWMTRLNPHSFATNLLLICFFLFFLGLEKKQAAWMFGTGFLWGALTLMRPEYQLGVLCLAFACWFLKTNLKVKLALSISLVIGWILFLTPWVVRNYRIHKHIVVSTTHYGINLWYVFNPGYTYQSLNPPMPEELFSALSNEPNEVKRADLYVAEAKKFIRENPKLVLERLVFNFLTYWRPWLSPKVTSLAENLVYTTSYAPLFLLFLLGIFKIPWNDPRWMAIAFFMVYKVLAHVPFYMIVRFREATMPLMLLIAALPIDRWITSRTKNI
jgi:4-amino-4-deoxy-L-arabinose transferase-like glycosyltransferase